MATIYLLTIILGTFLQVSYGVSPYENYRHPRLPGGSPNENQQETHEQPKLTDDDKPSLPLRVPSSSPYENYRHPRLMYNLALPHPLQVLRDKISNGFAKFEASDLEELKYTLPFALWKVPDTCQNISKALDELKTVTSAASSLIGEIATKLSGTWEESFKCMTFNIYKDVTCMMDTVKGYKEAYEEFKPQIVEMNTRLQNEFSKFFVVIQNCLANL